MAEIKGTALLDTTNAIKRRAGEPELAKIIQDVSPETKKIFEGVIQPSNWYPLDAFTEFLDADIRATAGGDRSVLIERSERVIEGQLRGIYKIFVKFGSPGFVITRISAVHSTYFQGILIVPEVEDHSALIKYIGFQPQHEILEYVIQGFFRKALQISGAKEISMKFTVPISQGGPYSELSINWS